MSRSKSLVAAGDTLESLSQEVEAWRQSRSHPGGRLPERFWKSAVQLVAEHGLQEVAESLRMDRRRLEGRLEDGDGSSRRHGGKPVFVEVEAITPSRGETCVLEFEDRRGGRLTVRLESGSNVDVTKMAESFWRCAR